MEKQIHVFYGHNDTLLKLEIAARRGKSVNFTNRLEGIDIDLVKVREGGFAECSHPTRQKYFQVI
jgi:membrane dipeptidase